MGVTVKLTKEDARTLSSLLGILPTSSSMRPSAPLIPLLIRPYSCSMLWPPYSSSSTRDTRRTHSSAFGPSFSHTTSWTRSSALRLSAFHPSLGFSDATEVTAEPIHADNTLICLRVLFTYLFPLHTLEILYTIIARLLAPMHICPGSLYQLYGKLRFSLFVGTPYVRGFRAVACFSDDRQNLLRGETCSPYKDRGTPR